MTIYCLFNNLIINNIFLYLIQLKRADFVEWLIEFQKKKNNNNDQLVILLESL